MSASDSRQSGEERFGAGLARAFDGAILFAYPMIMTMEMWWLGFYMEPLCLALLLLLTVPLLVGLSHYSGFEATSGWVDDVVDAFVALAVGFVASAAMLWLLASSPINFEVNFCAELTLLQKIHGNCKETGERSGAWA